MAECIVWDGAIDKRGYGHCWYHPADGSKARNEYVHRAVYELLVGPIPTGLQLDHLCRNRACANVDHLEAVSAGENIRRGVGLAAQNLAKTRCPRGHSLAENAYVYRGERSCRICRVEANRRWRARRR